MAAVGGAGATRSDAEGAIVGARRPGAGAEGLAGAGAAANEPGAVSTELKGAEDRSAEAAVSGGLTGTAERAGVARRPGPEPDGTAGTRPAGAAATGSMGVAANPVGASPKGAAAGSGRPKARTGAAVAAKKEEAKFDPMVLADAVTGAKPVGRRGGRVL